jgi:hypothetical protein
VTIVLLKMTVEKILHLTLDNVAAVESDSENKNLVILPEIILLKRFKSVLKNASVF